MATYYVDPAGSDLNPGVSPSSAWRTLANVNVVAAGSTIFFKRSGVWRETLLPKNNCTYASYGDLPDYSRSPDQHPDGERWWSSEGVPSYVNMPTFSGSDVVTGWTLVAGQANTYQASYGAAAAKGFVDAAFQQSTPLNLVASLAQVESTPGTIWSNAVYVYVHLGDGSDPGGHVVEVSGTRRYGIDCTGASGVTIDGLAVIHAAQSGFLAYGTQVTIANNVVKNCVFFNNCSTRPDSNPNINGLVMAHILSTYSFTSSAVPGLQVLSCYVGRTDWTHNTNNFAIAGIWAAGMIGALIQDCKVATINGWGLVSSDYYNQTSVPAVGNVINRCELTNCEGNIHIAGSMYAIVQQCHVHDSFGNAVQGGGSFISQSSAQSTALKLLDNRVDNILGCYGDSLYNGFDMNYVQNGLAIGNYISRVEHSCHSLEADSMGSINWMLKGNIYDASNNYGNADHAPVSATDPAFPMYVQAPSLPGIILRGNTFVFNSAYPYIRWGAANSADNTHDLSESTFTADYPTY